MALILCFIYLADGARSYWFGVEFVKYLVDVFAKLISEDLLSVFEGVCWCLLSKVDHF